MRALLLALLLSACERDFEVRGAPANIHCVTEDDCSLRCIADEVLYTCVHDGFWHPVLYCAPTKVHR